MTTIQQMSIKESPEISPKNTTLYLGDIIQIVAPSNTSIDEHAYYIFYLDETRMKLMDLTTNQLMMMEIKDYLADESIQGIRLLARNPEKGFARQFGLLPTKWVRVHFSGENPFHVSGEITNLEEDMVEITTYPELYVIYIDFQYKGLPEDPPVDKIEFIDRPQSVRRSLADLVMHQGEIDDAAERATIQYDVNGDFILNIPENAEATPTVKDIITDMIDVTAPIPEEEFDYSTITIMMDIPESQRRYSLEAQLNSLMEELTSKIPLEKRTPAEMEKIHCAILRYKQLHREFSIFDAMGNVKGIIKRKPTYKPLIEGVFSNKLKWIVPVTKEKRAICDVKDAKSDEVVEKIAAELKEYYKKSGALEYNKYDVMVQKIDELMDTTAPIEKQVYRPLLEVGVAASAGDIEVMLSKDEAQSHSEGVPAAKFVFLKKTDGLTKLTAEISTNRKKTYIRKNITPADKIYLDSLVFLTEPAVNYSRAFLHQTLISNRMQLSQKPIYLTRVFREKTEIAERSIRNLSKEYEYDFGEGVGEYEDRFLDTIKHMELSTEMEEPPGQGSELFSQFMNTIIPNTKNLVKWIKPYSNNVYSYSDLLKRLEPFLIYDADVCYKQYVEMWYFVKENAKKLRATILEKSREYSLFKSLGAMSTSHAENRVSGVLQKNKDIMDLFKACYYLHQNRTASEELKQDQIEGDAIAKFKDQYPFSSELLKILFETDNAASYFSLLSFLEYNLYTPDNIVESLDQANITETTGKANAACGKLFIAKKYTSLSSLQKDNEVDEIYYDKEYDDTPYELLSKYKDEKKRMSPEKFADFFEEALIQKHDCPKSMAAELAQTIIRGKKVVDQGQYAVLEIKPELPKLMDDKEKRDLEIEAGVHTKVEYYKRFRDNWVRDPDVDETSFIDSNTLFCNMAENCLKIDPVKKCVDNSTAAIQMRLATRARMIAEFDKRFSVSMDELANDLADSARKSRKQTQKLVQYKKIERDIHSIFSYDLGKYAKPTDELVLSPYYELREQIMGQSDFVKKQTDIVKFVETFCREPMEKELGEQRHWYYCLETNTKLFPMSLYLLAKSYGRGDYPSTLDTVCRIYGTLSEDGDSIVDKHTGGEFTLRKIEFSTDEGYTDEGYKVTTHSIMENDMAGMILGKLDKKDAAKQAALRTFEDKDTQMIYNVFKTLAAHIGISHDATETNIEDFVLRNSLDMLRDETIVSSEETYVAAMQKAAAAAAEKKAPVPWIVYKHQTLITLVACNILVAIQTTIPSFKTRKTFPRCVRSFDGYPLTGEENTDGIRYLACILYESKGSNAPWDSIKNLSASILTNRIRMVLSRFTTKRNEVETLYAMKRKYLLLHPEETVPEDHSVARWVQFMPPVVPFVLEKVQGISADFEKELLHLIKEGHRDQLGQIMTLKSKLRKHAYAIVELVAAVVSKKGTLLATSGGKPFLENACCNEEGSKSKPLLYFNNENPVLETYLRKAERIDELITKMRVLSKSPFWFHNENTRIQKTEANMVVEDAMNVYAAYMHYCNYNNDAPIPIEYEVLAGEKPAYSRYASMEEKVKFMKQHGRTYDRTQLHALMRIVANRNIVHLAKERNVDPIRMFMGILEHLDRENSHMVEENLRKKLGDVLSTYDAKVIHIEEDANMRGLFSYLEKTNRRMYQHVMKFMDTHGSLEMGERKKIDEFLSNVSNWEIGNATQEGIHMVLQYIRNSVYRITRLFPSMIINKTVNSEPAKHWGFSPQHNANLREAVSGYYRQLEELFESEEERMDGGFTPFELLLKEVGESTVNLVLFMNSIPENCMQNLGEGKPAGFTLFSKKILLELSKYCYLSVLYEHVELCRDPDFIQFKLKPVHEKRESFRENTLYTGVEMMETDAEEEITTIQEQLMQVQIDSSDEKELSVKVAKLLKTYIMMEMRNRQMTDFTYASIVDKTRIVKNKDKQRILDHLTRLSKENKQLLQIEQRHRAYGIGMWNVGQQKSLYKYDAGRYEIERNIAAEMKMTDGAIDGLTENIAIDVENLENQQKVTDDMEMSREEYGIQRLKENWADGDGDGDGYADEGNMDYDEESDDF
jgi:hypothetical protein